jgi:hypothetical protein
MNKAYIDDRENIMNKKPAINKLCMLEQLKKTLANDLMQDSFL